MSLFICSRSILTASASSSSSALPTVAAQCVRHHLNANTTAALSAGSSSSSTCSVRHFSLLFPSGNAPSFPPGSTTQKFPGPRAPPTFEDQSLDDESETFLRTRDGQKWEKPKPEEPRPQISNPFTPPKDTFIPLGQTWAEAQPNSQASELSPIAASTTTGHSQPFIYSSGGFIAANSLAALSLPSGPGTVSGIVATVFGGYGFLGRHLLSYLGRIGAQIIVPYRGDGMNVRRTKLAGEVGQVVPIPYSWDNLDPVVKAIQRSNVIINLLGQRKETTNFSYDDIHVKCTYKIAELAKKYGNVERFIHVSSIGAHPNSPSAFYRSKGEGENVVRHFFPSATIIRAAPMFADDDYLFNSIGRSISHNYGLHLFNEGKQQLAPTHVNDVAQAILAAIAFGESLGELYHLVGPKVYTALDLVLMAYKEACADVFHDYRKIKVNHGVEVDQFSYWWRSKLHKLQFSHHDSTNGVAYLLMGLVNQISAQVRINPDQIVQAYVNQVLPQDLPASSLKTYADLNIEPQNLEAHLPRLMLAYRGYRGPERFAEVERKSITPTRSANY